MYAGCEPGTLRVAVFASFSSRGLLTPSTSPTCHIVIVCIFLLITMRKSLIQLPHRLLVYNVVTVIRVNLTAEEIRQNWLLRAWHRDEASRFGSLSTELSAVIDKLFSKTSWHPSARMRLIQFLFHTYGVD